MLRFWTFKTNNGEIWDGIGHTKDDAWQQVIKSNEICFPQGVRNFLGGRDGISSRPPTTYINAEPGNALSPAAVKRLANAGVDAAIRQLDQT